MLEIDCEFPGGNIVVEGVEGDTVRVRPDLRDTEGHWCYWCFRVRGAAGRALRFEFERDDVGVRGPGVSLDGGLTWRWLGAPCADESGFSYAFPEEAGEVRFSFGMPYTQANLDRYLAARAGHARLRAGTLCESRKGRPVELLRAGKLARDPEHRVLIACRHHACEMMASYALEGLLDTVLAEDETGRWLRDRVEFMVAPFVDKDGVEDGDQGKSRIPHDHNRDYAAPCLYPEVEALRRLVPEWSEGRLRISLDLHCPWIRGEWNEHIYFVGMEEEAMWQRLGAFSEALARVRRGPLPYHAAGNLPFGVDWNKPEEYERPGSEPNEFSPWMSALPGVWFGATMELPYANARGVEVTAETARAFGRDLAAAVRERLEAES